MHDRGTRKILLVGDVSKAFLDANAAAGKCDLCASIPEAIKAAASNDYDAVTVVMHGISNRLASALKTLRQTCDTRIVLLAQMYEEPIAIQLVGSVANGTTLANDYLICPIHPNTLYESVMGAPAEGAAETGSAVTIDATTAMRIRQLEKLATEDDLTGLKNRRYIWEFSRQIIERSAKEARQVTLLVFDIDDFKHYNDVYGHNAGDEILKQAAALIKRCCRAHDVVGRIGGDEFAVVFWDDP
ncbi:MAG: diguanylate cyclase, partial [Phycisphaerales bacterium]